MEHVLPLEIWEHILSYVDDLPSFICLAQEHPCLRQRYIQEERWKDRAAFTCKEDGVTQCISDIGKKLSQSRYHLFLQGYPKQVVCTLQWRRGYKTDYKRTRLKVKVNDITLFIGDKQYKMQGSERFVDYLSPSDIVTRTRSYQ